jgi:ABC-type nickel/cobalt efflux system permease component RcnA
MRSPLVRGLAIIAVISLAIVLLNQETSLATANALVRVAFFLAVAFAAYMLWRDFGRREISVWPALSQWVFYGAVALFLVDLGWFFFTGLSGLDALAFFLVAGACVYAAVRTWRRQRRYY